VELTALEEAIDIGLGVGAGFIYGAIGAEVKDCVHKGDPFDSFLAGQDGADASALLLKLPMLQLRQT
jgi:hypothetical protein